MYYSIYLYTIFIYLHLYFSSPLLFWMIDYSRFLDNNIEAIITQKIFKMCLQIIFM